MLASFFSSQLHLKADTEEVKHPEHHILNTEVSEHPGGSLMSYTLQVLQYTQVETHSMQLLQPKQQFAPNTYRRLRGKIMLQRWQRDP